MVSVLDMDEDEKQDIFYNAEDSAAAEPPAEKQDEAAEAPEQGTDAGTEETEETEEPDGDYDPAAICTRCGSQQNIYHVDREKPLCGRCLEQKNHNNRSKIEQAITEKKRILVRPFFGYGCRLKYSDCTCFRFTVYGNDKKPSGPNGGRSWTEHRCRSRN